MNDSPGKTATDVRLNYLSHAFQDLLSRNADHPALVELVNDAISYVEDAKRELQHELRQDRRSRAVQLYQLLGVMGIGVIVVWGLSVDAVSNYAKARQLQQQTEQRLEQLQQQGIDVDSEFEQTLD